MEVWRRMFYFHFFENLSSVDEIKHKIFWRIDGFIGAIFYVSIPHIGQLVTWSKSLWILKCRIMHLGVFNCQFGAMVG